MVFFMIATSFRHQKQSGNLDWSKLSACLVAPNRSMSQVWESKWLPVSIQTSATELQGDWTKVATTTQIPEIPVYPWHLNTSHSFRGHIWRYSMWISREKYMVPAVFRLLITNIRSEIKPKCPYVSLVLRMTLKLSTSYMKGKYLNTRHPKTCSKKGLKNQQLRKEKQLALTRNIGSSWFHHESQMFCMLPQIGLRRLEASMKEGKDILVNDPW